MRKHCSSKTRDSKYKNINNKKKRQSIKKRNTLKRIKIKIVENPVENAIDHYNTLKGNNPCTTNFETDVIVLTRITLNYIRHKQTNYDIVVRELGLQGNNDTKSLRSNVNFLIIKKYGDNFITKEVELKRKINVPHNT